MSVRDLILSAASGASKPTYVDDVFATTLYMSSPSYDFLTVNTGIDSVNNTTMIWTRNLTSGFGGAIYDTIRGVGSNIAASAKVSATIDVDTINQFLTTGFVVGSDEPTNYAPNYLGVSWTFVKDPNFFDILSYTGTGAIQAVISHGLASAPGIILFKNLSISSDWQVWHKDIATITGDVNSTLHLNDTTVASNNGGITGISNVNSTNITIGSVVNNSGASFIGYAFPHDTSGTGLSQCGSYTGNGSTAGPVINLGWEPQFILVKSCTGTTGGWQMLDTTRGIASNGNDLALQANTNIIETAVDYVNISATGFQVVSTSSEVNTSGAKYIYLAIRRSNKPPKTPGEVHYPSSSIGTGAAKVFNGMNNGFKPDLIFWAARNGGTDRVFIDNFRGSKIISSSNTAVEQPVTNYGGDVRFIPKGFMVSDNNTAVNANGTTYIAYTYKRALGFMDIINYQGTGAAQTIPHSLGAAPELILIKNRQLAGGWYACLTTDSTNKYMSINSNAASVVGGSGFFGPTQTAVNTSVGASLSNSGYQYVAYMFASIPGISKIGTYVGDGTAEQFINSGIAYPRSVLIKAISTTGDWYMWGYGGISSVQSWHFSLNNTSALVTTDVSVKASATGFSVLNAAATNINTLGVTYLYFAIGQ